MKRSDAKIGILVQHKVLTKCGFIVDIGENCYKEVCYYVKWQDKTTTLVHPSALELVTD